MDGELRCHSELPVLIQIIKELTVGRMSSSTHWHYTQLSILPLLSITRIDGEYRAIFPSSLISLIHSDDACQISLSAVVLIV